MQMPQEISFAHLNAVTFDSSATTCYEHWALRTPSLREYGDLLIEERKCLIKLLNKGAILRAIIHPSASPGAEPARMKRRLRLLEEFLSNRRGPMRYCDIVMSVEEGNNLLFFDDEVLFEGIAIFNPRRPCARRIATVLAKFSVYQH
jgi:hypothetical protein